MATTIRVLILDAQAKPVDPDLVMVWTLEILIDLLKRKESDLRKEMQIARERNESELVELQRRSDRAARQLKDHGEFLMKQEVPMTR